MKNIKQRSVDCAKCQGIVINTITSKDVESKKIRILVCNKPYFPKAVVGEPKKHELIVIYKDKEYSASYTIGSWDRGSRSGILQLDKILYETELKIRAGAILEMERLANEKYLIHSVSNKP